MDIHQSKLKNKYFTPKQEHREQTERFDAKVDRHKKTVKRPLRNRRKSFGIS